MTNRFLALPIFALVMTLVFYVSVTTVGAVATDWANDGVFGDGWHLFGIGSAGYEEATGEYEVAQAEVDAYLAAAAENGVAWCAKRCGPGLASAALLWHNQKKSLQALICSGP